MSETPTFGRYAEIPYDKMNPEQQAGYNAMIEARGRLPGPTKIWVHNPKLAKVAGPYGAHFQKGQYSLSEREREIAVLMYVKNMTLREIGQILGVSESRVCQIHGQLKHRLREALRRDADLFQEVA